MANAWEIPGGQFSLDVAAALDFRRFVKVNADGQAEYATAATDPIVGITYTEAPVVGAPVSIVGSGIAMVEASAAITAGDFVAPTTDGKAVTSANETQFVALTSAAAGALVTVKLN